MISPNESPTQHNATICLWNARSIRNKTTTLNDYLIVHDVDVMRITESWLNVNDTVVIGECTPPTYSYLNYPRDSDDPGGIYILL